MTPKLKLDPGLRTQLFFLHEVLAFKLLQLSPGPADSGPVACCILDLEKYVHDEHLLNSILHHTILKITCPLLTLVLLDLMSNHPRCQILLSFFILKMFFHLLSQLLKPLLFFVVVHPWGVI